MKKIVFALVLAVGGLMSPAPASAAVTMKLSDGVNPDVNITDNGTGDSNSASGVITFIGTIGTWSLNVSTGLDDANALGPVIMDLNSVNTSTGASTLTIDFTQTDLSGNYPGFILEFGGTISGGTATADLFLDTANGGATTSLVGSLGPVSGTFAEVASFDAIVDAEYSLTQRLTINATDALTYSGDFAVTPTPEPATLAMWGIGAMGVLIAGRFRRKSK